MNCVRPADGGGKGRGAPIRWLRCPFEYSVRAGDFCPCAVRGAREAARARERVDCNRIRRAALGGFYKLMGEVFVGEKICIQIIWPGAACGVRRGGGAPGETTSTSIDEKSCWHPPTLTGLRPPRYRGGMSDLLPNPYFYQQLPALFSSGAAVIRDEHGRILVEKPNYRDHWLLPGGGVDAGEDAREATARELHEELNLDLPVGRLLSVSWVPSSAAYGAPMGVHFVFDAGVVPEAELRDRVRLQEEELEAWDLIDPRDAAILSPWGAERVWHALDVLEGRSEVDLFAVKRGENADAP